MKRHHSGIWVLALAPALVLAACGSDDAKQRAEALSSCSAPSDLRETTWVRCTNEEEGIARRNTIEFGCREISITEVVFEQAGCEGDAIITIRQTYDGQFGPEIPDADGVRALDLTARSASVRAENQSGADFLNDVRFCGISNWKAATESNLFDRAEPFGGADCPIEPENVEVYTSFLFKDGMLFFPEGNPAAKADDRPDEVSESPFDQRTF